MLLRNPISTTKRFFQRTLESFKSFIGAGEGSDYQRLPKTSPFNNPFSCARNVRNMEAAEEFPPFLEPPREKQSDREDTQEKLVSFKKSSNTLKIVEKPKGKESEEERRRMKERRDAKMCLVTKRLKEMEKVDKGNVDHLLDIEEVFHYYTRLTCTAYLDIVDKYFMELYAEFFGVEQVMQGGSSSAIQQFAKF